MTPLHPDLRKALLKKREHIEAGLTPARLTRYERLATQYFYAVEYPEDFNPDRPISRLAIYILTPEAIENICSRLDNEPEICTKLRVLQDRGIQGGRIHFIAVVGQVLGVDLNDPDYSYIRDIILDEVQIRISITEGGIPRTPGDIIREVNLLRERYLPKFDEVHRKWADRQRRRLTRREFDVNPFPAIAESFHLLGKILLGLFTGKQTPYPGLIRLPFIGRKRNDRDDY